jgi:RimJ/RimL family protein N-acetyltransferase
MHRQMADMMKKLGKAGRTAPCAVPPAGVFSTRRRRVQSVASPRADGCRAAARPLDDGSAREGGVMQRCVRPPEGAAAAAAAAARQVIPRIGTARLLLRAADLGDFPAWAAFFEDGSFEGGEERAWEEYCVYSAGWLLHGHGLWAVERREDGALLGFVMLGLEWGDAEPEIGWMLTPAARGNGYATEAAAAVRDFAEDLLGPGRAVSYIDRDNAASIRVAERLGARRGSWDAHPEIWVYRHRAGEAPA